MSQRPLAFIIPIPNLLSSLLLRGRRADCVGDGRTGSSAPTYDCRKRVRYSLSFRAQSADWAWESVLRARRRGTPKPPLRQAIEKACHSEPSPQTGRGNPFSAPAGAELQSLPLRGRDMPRQRCGIKPPRITPPITQQEAPSRVLPVPLFALFSALSFSPSRPCRPETAPPSRRTPPRPRQTSWVRCSARRW